ncbi:MAG: nucleotide sugar dehydrogenase [Capnocytophaga sp.]|nr:nucleotide sugar dehydrogenase [Capnocytophaga sp.]
MISDTIKIAVIGLGYVGLPLARLFATRYPVVGFDLKKERVQTLMRGHDDTLEVANQDLQAVLTDSIPITNGLYCTTGETDIAHCNVYIVTVPTPVDKNNRPVLKPLLKASKAVGKYLQKNDTVIYESTVYPGCTEEECIPVLEKYSGLVFNRDFGVGYSPERVNPGDKKHTVENILKITSGSNPQTALHVDKLYRSVLKAGTHLAPTLKVAEAAKVIENSQRDVNIAFVNELAKIFNIMNIDTQAVLEAAGTKWNFLPFRPGLVGGHCTGVDPYYLAQKAQEVGYHPEIILAGRRMNDSMGHYVASETVKLMIQNDIRVKNASILVLGVTFKENCPDTRNTKVTDVVKHLEEYHAQVTVYDPWANPDEVQREHGFRSVQSCPKNSFDAIILAVAHREFLTLDFDLLKNKNAVVYDVKGVLKDKANKKL